MMPISMQNYAIGFDSGQPVRGGASGGSGNGASSVYGAAGASASAPLTPFDASEAGGQAQGSKDAKDKGRFDKNECHTCANRTYQDGSDDPGVSFKTPTKMAPQQAATAVMSHEMEHVTRNQAKAKEEGREVLSQSVSIHMGVCAECGKSYVAGGTTRTVTGQRGDGKKAFEVGLPNGGEPGQQLDRVA